MKLVWSNRAATDRLAIFVWIAEDNPQAVADVDERIEAAAQRLKDFPNSGRPGRIEGTRERPFLYSEEASPALEFCSTPYEGGEGEQIRRNGPALEGQQVERWRLGSCEDRKTGMGLPAMVRLMVE